MKKIGIIFAMEEEINAFKEHIHIDKEENIFDLHLYEGTFNNNQCIFTVSGVGKVNSARTCQILIDHYNTDIVINVGVAGGINNSLKVGDIIIGNKLVQHDFDITAFNHKLGYIPNIGIYINSNNHLVNLSKKILKNNNYTFYIGTIASGDIFCTDKKQSNKIANEFEALCVEMEGASIAQVCHLCHIPFLVIRCISDVPNNNNVITYEEFLDISSKKIALVLKKIIEEV